MRAIVVRQSPAARPRAWPATDRPFSRVKPIIALALGVLAGLAAETAAAKRPVDELTDGILKHVRESLPTSAARSVDAEAPRVRFFAVVATEFSVYPVDPAKLLAAANAAIDAANGPAATADSLLRAAIPAAAAALTSAGGAPASKCEQCEASPRRPANPTSVQAAAIRVVSFPTLNLPEMAENKSCSVLDRYFDFPVEGVSGVILDLRGNQGGPLKVATCVAGEFLAPRTPLFRIVERKVKDAQIIETPTDARPSPLTLPLVVLIDQDTGSGALALAASLRDAGRATLMGRSKEQANGSVTNLFATPREYVVTSPDRFSVPIGYIQRLGGAPLSAGVEVDVVVSSHGDDEFMEAARARFAGAPR